jgi:hypothetical protein
VAQGDVGFFRQVQAQWQSEAQDKDDAQENIGAASHRTPVST